MSHIVISYSQKDIEFARHRRRLLENEGFGVWMDETRLVPADRWWPTIERSIETCAAVLALIVVAAVLITLNGRDKGDPTATQMQDSEAAAAPTILTQTPEPTIPTETPTPTLIPAGSRNADWTPVVQDVNDIPFVKVPAGCFMMGSDDGYDDEKPVHEVCLSEFWIMQTEVTNAQYKRCVDERACTLPAEVRYYDDPEYADHPVGVVDWQQASDFAAWLNGQLPTEAQWEYAARGPESWEYPWGNSFDGTRLNYCDLNCEYDWKDSNFDDGRAQTAPVGMYVSGASWAGALDMSGNAWEWVADWYDYYGTLAEGVLDPAGPVSGSSRVVRGGAWDDAQDVARCAFRYNHYPLGRSVSLGFRVVVASPIINR